MVGMNCLYNLSFLIIYSFAVKRRGCFTRISSPLIRRLENIRCGEPLPTYFQVNRDVGVRVMAGTKVAEKRGVAEDTSNMVAKRQGPLKKQSLDRISQFYRILCLTIANDFGRASRVPQDQ